jgi:hypothetical protein
MSNAYTDRAQMIVRRTGNADINRWVTERVDVRADVIRAFGSEKARPMLVAIASDTEHPRAFEVVATLIKNTAEANEKLLNMQKQMREMKGMNKKDSGGVNVDKAIFVGSTSELSKLIKGKNGNNE